MFLFPPRYVNKLANCTELQVTMKINEEGRALCNYKTLTPIFYRNLGAMANRFN